MTQFATLDTTPLYPLAAMPGAAEVLDVVLDVLARVRTLTICRWTTRDGGVAEVDHETNVIRIAPGATPAEARCGLLACLLFVLQEESADENADMRAVQEKIVHLMVPPSELSDGTTAGEVATRFGVDLPTAHLAIRLARTAA